MAEADKSGRAAQILGDRLTTLGMSLAEYGREVADDFDREMAKVQAVLDGAGGNLDALREWARPCIADQDPGLWGDQA